MVNQFDGRFSRAEGGCERSCFYRRHKGQVACKRDDQCAHFCLSESLQRAPKIAAVNPEALTERVATKPSQEQSPVDYSGVVPRRSHHFYM
jgi:hypothetical protein